MGDLRLDDSTPTVLDVAVRRPKRLSVEITVDQARDCLADDHTHMLLITDGPWLVGTIERGDLDGPIDPSGLALPHAQLEGRTIAPAVPAEAARQLLVESGRRRLAVVSDDGRLLGLLCLKRHRRGFCSEEDVRSRADSAPVCLPATGRHAGC